jgi:hypothetical protein
MCIVLTVALLCGSARCLVFPHSRALVRRVEGIQLPRSSTISQGRCPGRGGGGGERSPRAADSSEGVAVGYFI